MRNRLSVALHISTGFMVFFGFASLTSVRGYPSTLLLLPLITLLIMPFGERLDLRYPGYRIITNALTIAFGCFLPLLFLSLGLLYSVIGLVFFITCFLLIHRKTERNYYYIFLMSFFMLLAAAVQSPEPVVGLVLAGYVISAVWSFALVRLYFDLHGGHVPESGPGLRFAERHSGLELAGLKARILPRKVQFDGALTMALFLLGFAAIGLTALIFMFTPRIEAGILGRSDMPIAQTGIDSEVDLTGGNYIQQDFTVVMRVVFPDGHDRLPARLYWRITTLPSYFNSRWSRRNLRDHYQPEIPSLFPRHIETLLRANPFEVNRQGRPAYPLVRQEIFMDDVPEEGVPTLELVQRVALPSQPRNTRLSWDSGQDFTVKLNRSGLRQLDYEVFSEVGQPLIHELREAPEDYSFMAERDFEMLTYHDLLPETIALVEEITANAETIYDKAAAISEWLSSDRFMYTFDVPQLSLDHAIDNFILDVRMGHCELFASAMALMLRSQGVPTRVVVGYMGGEWTESEQAFVVRASMAHLWAEVLIPDYGWVRFDPSPRGEEDYGGALDNFARQMALFALRAKMFWFQEVVAFDSATQWDRLRNFSLELFQDLSITRVDDTGSMGYRIPYPLLALMGTVATLCALAYVFMRRNRTRAMVYLLTEDQDRAARLYAQLRRKLRRFGLDRPSDTAEELAQRIAEAPLENREHAMAVLQTYNAVRFGLRPLEAPHYQRLRKSLRDLRLQREHS